ncbi:MAG: 3'-5' exonuclease [Chitinophagales bacterium]
MTFVAIDFETATYHAHSACSVGIVTVENGIITDEFTTLIQPPDNFYSYHNINVHGITSKDTKDTGTFEQHYVEIYKRLLHRKVVAHNESFDRNVLKRSISYYGLSSKGLSLHKSWECTVKIYRSLGFHPNKLSDCCVRLNIPLNHHEALSDARACAKLYLNYLQNYSIEQKIIS